jgi:PKD repeat protein
MRLRATMVLAALFLLLPMVASAQNQPPVADAGEDQTVFVNDFVPLDGTNSFDPDGDPIVVWQWEFDSLPTGSGATLTNPFNPTPGFTPDLPGQYVVSLVVSDGIDESAPNTIATTASVNQQPVAVAESNVTEGSAPLTVHFDGSASYDPEGQPLYYFWSFGDSSLPVEAPIVSHTYAVAGSYEAILTVAVLGDNSQVDTDSIEITVTEPPLVPALSPLGTAVLVLLLLGSAAFVLRRVRAEAH